MAFLPEVYWTNTLTLLICSGYWWQFSRSAQPQKVLAPQHISSLCGSAQIAPDDIAEAGDELAICRFAPAGGDGVAEIPVQNIQIPPVPGHFNEMPDGAKKIAFIGIFMA